MKEFVVVPKAHNRIIKSADVIQMVVRFLEEGTFEPESVNEEQTRD